MSDYTDAEEIKEIYAKHTDQQIIELNKTIVALRTKISYLEKRIEEYEKVPVPRPIVEQIVHLEAKNKKLEKDIEYYKKFVPVQVIINKENKEQPTRRGGLK